MTHGPQTGRIPATVDLRQLKTGDVIAVQIDHLRPTAEWTITITSVDPMLAHRKAERWITGLRRNGCRVLVRAARCQES